MIATYDLISKITDEEVKLQVIQEGASDDQVKGILNFNLTEVILLWAEG